MRIESKLWIVYYKWQDMDRWTMDGAYNQDEAINRATELRDDEIERRVFDDKAVLVIKVVPYVLNELEPIETIKSGE